MLIKIGDHKIIFECLALCVIDILFFPYIRPLSCSFSMIVLLLLSIKHVDIILNNKCIIVMGIAGISSLLFGSFVLNISVEAAPFAIVVFSMIALAHMSNTIDSINMAFIFKIYLIFSSLFAILYLVSPQEYFNVRSFFTMNNAKIFYESSVINRYTNLFSDPNNAACSFVAILAYLVLFTKARTIELFFIISAATLCVLTTFSITGLLTLCAFFILVLFIEHENKNKIVLYYILGFFIAIFILLGIEINFSSRLYDGLIFRFTNADFSSTGGRLQFWIDTLKNALNWYNIIIGKGAVVGGYLERYLPHNGHFFLFISYGLLSNITFYLMFLRFNKHCILRSIIVIFPMFLAFSINTGVSDYRFMMLYALLVASINGSEQKLPGTYVYDK